jgi:hypothetical protein
LNRKLAPVTWAKRVKAQKSSPPGKKGGLKTQPEVPPRAFCRTFFLLEHPAGEKGRQKTQPEPPDRISGDLFFLWACLASFFGHQKICGDSPGRFLDDLKKCREMPAGKKHDLKKSSDMAAGKKHHAANRQAPPARTKCRTFGKPEARTGKKRASRASRREKPGEMCATLSVSRRKPPRRATLLGGQQFPP